MQHQKKGYKHTALGWIPEEWEVKKIKDIGKITSGTTPLRSVSEYHSGNIPWVKTTDLNNSVILGTEEKVTELALKETSLRIYPKGTVLVAMYGGFNQIGRTGILGIDAAINQALSAITVDLHKTDPKFLLDWLNANIGLWKTFAGSSRKDPNITSNDVGDFPFVEISLLEQRKIAAILSTWDKAIEKEQHLISALQKRHRALSQRLLSGKVRLEGFRKKVLNNSLLKPFIYEVTKRNNSDALIPVLSVTNARGFIRQNEQFDREVASEDKANYKVVSKGQFAFNPSRINVGSVDWLRSFEKGLLSPMYVIFKTEPIELLPAFLYHHLKSTAFTKRIPMFVQGSVRDTLSFDGLCGMKFFIPALDEQSAIANILATSEHNIAARRTHLATLQSQKKGLMQQLLTGKKRVKL